MKLVILIIISLIGYIYSSDSSQSAVYYTLQSYQDAMCGGPDDGHFNFFAVQGFCIGSSFNRFLTITKYTSYQIVSTNGSHVTLNAYDSGDCTESAFVKSFDLEIGECTNGIYVTESTVGGVPYLPDDAVVVAIQSEGCNFTYGGTYYPYQIPEQSGDLYCQDNNPYLYYCMDVWNYCYGIDITKNCRPTGLKSTFVNIYCEMEGYDSSENSLSSSQSSKDFSYSQ